MKRPERGTWWLMGGGLVLLAGIVWTLASLQRYPERQRQIERKLSDLEQIVSYQQVQERELAAVRTFEELAARRPPDLGALLREQWPDTPAEVRRRESRSAWGDWQAIRMETSFPQIALDDLGRLLSVAEQQRPPWRLVEGNILAAEQRPGAARATLVFEGLSR